MLPFGLPAPALPYAGAPILTTGRHVVIGGGDTGSDCIGTANRQGAASVTKIEILPEPPLREDKGLTWPHWPAKLRTSSSQEEGCRRDFDIVTSRLEGKDRRVVALHLEQGRWWRSTMSGLEDRADLRPAL